MRFAVSSVVLLAASASSFAQTPANAYVGPTACRTCHPNQWATFYKNPHFKSVASGKEPPERTGCESCHGPGQRHVEQHGGKSTIVAFSEASPELVLDTCLRCHSQTLSRANIRRSSHTQNGVVCTNCHLIHNPTAPRRLLAKAQATLCYDCHPDVRAQFSMPFKHRVDEGFMACTDCHNPHGAFAPSWRMAALPRMTAQAKGNEEPCLTCHADKRGPFVFEHPAVRVDGCGNCHVPHGSTNSRLLKRPVVFTLCLECHNGADNFGRQANGVFPVAATHNFADSRYQNCTACHVRIHGSNADVTFLR
jgi:DmsE family decaheme c-type cytochrome